MSVTGERYENKDMKILLLEDDKSLNRGITLTLEKAGYQVDSAFTLAEAEERLESDRYALIICDITLSDGSGLELGRKIREIGDTYFIYLTALDSEIDMVNGYDTGADDYITKPFSLMVLVSKVNALMRRIGGGAEHKSVLTCGEIEVNCQEMKVYKSGRENAGRIVSKENILTNIWDMDGQFVDENTVTVNISRLKKKLGTDEISNVRGLGYIWSGNVIRR